MLALNVVGIICAILGGIVIFMHYALTEERNKAAQNVVKSTEEAEAEKVVGDFLSK